jgi:hypothetical protein
MLSATAKIKLKAFHLLQEFRLQTNLNGASRAFKKQGSLTAQLFSKANRY